MIHRRNLGLTARAKLLYQFLRCRHFAVALLLLGLEGSYSTRLNIPFLKHYQPSLLIPGLTHCRTWDVLAFLPFIIFVALVVVFSSNAVNLTDGLDGLAIG